MAERLPIAVGTPSRANKENDGWRTYSCKLFLIYGHQLQTDDSGKSC